MAQLDLEPVEEKKKLDLEPVEAPQSSLTEKINISGEPRTDKPGDLFRGANLETVPMDVVKTLAQTPIVEGVKQIGRTGQMLSDVLFGGKSMSEAATERFPESQKFVGIEEKPIRERTAIGAETLTNLLFAAAIGKGITEPGALTEHSRPAASEQAAKEVIQDATQKRNIPQDRVAEHPRDGGSGLPAEAGGGGGAVTEAPVTTQEGKVESQSQTVGEPQAKDVTLYHATPKEFDTFEESKATPTGLGGKGHYFSDKPEGAYGEKTIPVTVPKSKIANLAEIEKQPEFQQGGNIDELLKSKGYEGTFNPKTGEYVLYEPNKFLQQPSVQTGAAQGEELFAAEDVPFNLRGEQAQTGITAEGQSRASAEAAAEQTKAQPELTGMPEAERPTIAGKTRESAEERAMREEYERETLEAFQQHMGQGGSELLEAVKSGGGIPALSSARKELSGELQNIREAYNAPRKERIKYADLFRKDAPDIDALTRHLKSQGFDVETPADTLALIENRLRTGKAVYGSEARGFELESQSFGKTPLPALGITAENPGIAPKIIRTIQTAADILRSTISTRPPSVLEAPKLSLETGGVKPPPPNSIFSPDTPPGSDPVPIYATRVNNVFKRWWEKFWPRDLAVQKTVPDSPVISEHQRILKTQMDYMEGFANQPWWKALRGRSNDELIELEDRVVKEYRSHLENGVPRDQAYEAAVSKMPKYFQDIVRYRESRVPIEQAAADELGVERPNYTGDPYIARLTNEEGKDIVDLHPRVGSLGKQIRSTIGSFDNSRVHTTMKDGILQGAQYEPIARSVWLRELNSIRLEATANLVRNLKQAGTLFEDKAEAFKASPNGRITMVRGLGGKTYWARSPEEAVFLDQNISTVPGSPLGKLQQLANTYIRNPSLVNPLPHVTKNMFFKWALARIGNAKFRADTAEFRGATPSELKTRFDHVMPFVETGERMPQLTAREVGTWSEKLMTRGLKINDFSSNFIFSKADPAMRYSLWKSYVRKGMSDQEAANHVWIDLIRYDANSGGMNFWKSIPLNFFVPWRTGTYVTLAKQLTSHPIRSLLFIGAVEYLREIRYRQTGKWTHLPVDYIDAPLSEAIQNPKSAPAAAATTLLFGPGGGQAPSSIKDVMDLVRGDPQQKARVVNMFWGISQLYNMPREFQAWKKDGNPQHLVNLVTEAAVSEHSALKYEPRRLMKWMPEWMPGLQKSELVQNAESMRERIAQRQQKAKATFEARHGVSASFERTTEEEQLDALERGAGKRTQRTAGFQR